MIEDAQLAGTLRTSVMRLARRLRQERGDHALTLTQLATLATLDRLGRSTPTALAAQERVRPPSMTRVLASLTDLGLVERAADPTDGRQVLVQPTVKGRALLRQDRARREAWLAQALVGLTARERATLAAAEPILAKLAQR